MGRFIITLVTLASLQCLYGQNIVKEYTVYQDLYLLGNTRLSYEEFYNNFLKPLTSAHQDNLRVDDKMSDNFNRSVVREALAQYLNKNLVNLFL